jgi:TPR repeat protein
VFLEQARTAVKADDWIRAGQAWVNAAREGNREATDQLPATVARLRPLADGASPDGQALLAGILMDYFDDSALPAAVSYARAAAKARHPAGMRTYGYMLHNARGVDKDSVQAAALFRSAAQAGDAYGAFNLAGLHLLSKPSREAPMATVSCNGTSGRTPAFGS